MSRNDSTTDGRIAKLALPAALQGLSFYLAQHHDLTLDDVEPTTTRGYWLIKKSCGGRAGGCTHPLHGTLFNEGDCHHTVSYMDSRRNGTRFASPYRTWHFHPQWLAEQPSA